MKRAYIVNVTQYVFNVFKHNNP